MFSQIVILITACWLILWAFIIKTENIQSSLIFKAVPFGLGMCCLYVSAKMFGWI
jgi:hypothetical protein